MKKLLTILLIAMFLATGCAIPLPGISPSATGGQQQQLQSGTTVLLSAENYKILKTSVVGSDWGINLLGLFPIVSPDYAKAMSKLYKAGDLKTGTSQAIVNVIQQHTAPFFILFSIPRITFSADVVEFTAPAPRR